ncbi:DDE-type integrase/transposase/recombinase [Nonomuraea sp. B12E4]|uniref:DDE-type integrase/transposase/recombinase n=1 Tax=Nonomuraea sp. B12E4 TaxID=3153564 RepID=UPI00325F75C7
MNAYGEGPLYLATVIDCFSKAVIGWALDVRYPAGLVCAALDMPAMRVDIPVGTIFHSDRGSEVFSAGKPGDSDRMTMDVEVSSIA